MITRSAAILLALAWFATAPAAAPTRKSAKPETRDRKTPASQRAKKPEAKKPATPAAKPATAPPAKPAATPPPKGKPAGPEKKPGAPAPAKPTRLLVTNGGFETYTMDENYWDGVVSGDYIAGRPRSARAVTENSRLGSIAFPVSVSFADVNADGKSDILMADPHGYYYAYFNRGESPTQPVFDQAEILPLYLSTSRYWYRDSREGDRVPRDRYRAQRIQERMCVRATLADWGRSGLLDLFVGNFAGEIFFLPNKGNSRSPKFEQPSTLPSALVPTDVGGRLWANLLAPAVGQFSPGGKPDLLVGEGSYSANSVHLLVDSSNARVPKFEPANRHYLCYGMGREHLLPTVVDFNADGFPDVITGDRTGELSLFLHPGKRWKPGTDIPFSTTLTLGNQAKQGGMVSPCAGDFNGDGLFDLLLGKPNGRIAVALNTGAKGAPKFAAPADIKAKDLWRKEIRQPVSWRAEPGLDRGNAMAYFTVVDEKTDPGCAPPEGKCVLLGSHMPVPNKVFTFPPGGIPGCDTIYELIQGVPLQVGSTYELDFKVKGAGVRGANVVFEVLIVYVPKKRVSLGERRAVEYISEWFRYEDDFAAGPQWTTVRKRFTFEFKNAVLNKELTSANVTLRIEASLSFGRGRIYYDDVKLTRAP